MYSSIERLPLRQEIMTQNLCMIIIESESQMVLNPIPDKIFVSKEIINLMEDIRMLSSVFKDIRIDYRHRVCTGEANKSAKHANVHLVCSSIVSFVWSVIYSLFFVQEMKKENIKVVIGSSNICRFGIMITHVGNEWVWRN